MFDIGWSELLLIGIVALIVVGPKDLPMMFRQLGRFTAKARSMAREFSRAMEDAARDTGVGDVANDLKAMTSKKSLGLDALERAADRFEKWDPKLPTAAAAAAAAPKAPQAVPDPEAAVPAERAAPAAAPLGTPFPAAVAEPAAPAAAPAGEATPVKRIAKTRKTAAKPADAVGATAKATAAAKPKKPARKAAAKTGEA